MRPLDHPKLKGKPWAWCFVEVRVNIMYLEGQCTMKQAGNQLPLHDDSTLIFRRKNSAQRQQLFLTKREVARDDSSPLPM